ncbi:MAG: LPS export ABC transporter periplasmic protein LptC [Gammaproteobacteria bacterium]|nr:LPS export ABC transporter periplasmic protein LptC [Gammaproteobacteria bacterium]
MRTSISLIIVFILALLSIWLQDAFQKTPIVQPEKDEHFPDYFMENFTITNMDENGQVAYSIQAKKLEHFADDNSAEIIEPFIEFKDRKGDWTISAERAHFLGQQNIIHLYEKVHIIRAGSNTRSPLSIETNYLVINADSQIAQTDKPAHIKTRDSELDTVGMVFDNRQGILKLLSRVRGTYAVAK